MATTFYAKQSFAVFNSHREDFLLDYHIDPITNTFLRGWPLDVFGRPDYDIFPECRFTLYGRRKIKKYRRNVTFLCLSAPPQLDKDLQCPPHLVLLDKPNIDPALTIIEHNAPDSPAPPGRPEMSAPQTPTIAEDESSRKRKREVVDLDDDSNDAKPASKRIAPAASTTASSTIASPATLPASAAPQNMKTRKGTAWNQEEKKFCLEAIKDILESNPKLSREKVWPLVSAAMTQAGYNRTTRAITNTMSRTLRAESGWDERKNKRPDAMQTGVIGGPKVGRYTKATK